MTAGRQQHQAKSKAAANRNPSVRLNAPLVAAHLRQLSACISLYIALAIYCKQAPQEVQEVEISSCVVTPAGCVKRTTRAVVDSSRLAPRNNRWDNKKKKMHGFTLQESHRVAPKGKHQTF